MNMHPASNPASNPASVPGGMARRWLRGLGRETSVLGGGCWPLGGPTINHGRHVGWGPVDDDTAHRALRAAHEAGIRLFDTADVYGHGASERRLGTLVRAVGRDDLTLISKVGHSGDGGHPYRPDRMRHQLHATLRRLGTDHLDVYAFHSEDFGPADTYLDDAVATMDGFRTQGLILATGMRGPHTFAEEWAHQDQHPRQAATARFLDLVRRLHPAVIAVRYNVLSPPPGPGRTGIHAFAVRSGIGVLAKQVLAQGLLTGSRPAGQPMVFGPGDHRWAKAAFTPAGRRIVNDGLQPLRDHFGDDPARLTSAAIRYVLQTAPDVVALIGLHTAAQARDLTLDLTSPLTDDELLLLRDSGDRIRHRLQHLPRPSL